MRTPPSHSETNNITQPCVGNDTYHIAVIRKGKEPISKMAYLAVFENIGKYVLFVLLQNMNNTENTFLSPFIVISEG